MLRHSNRRSGFTILEIMLAIGVLMAGSLGAIAVYRMAVTSHRSAEDQAAAALAAEGLMADYAAFCTYDNLLEYENSSGESVLDQPFYEFSDAQCTNYPQFYYDLRLDALPFHPEDAPGDRITTIRRAAELLVTLKLKHFPDTDENTETEDKRAYEFKTVFLMKPL